MIVVAMVFLDESKIVIISLKRVWRMIGVPDFPSEAISNVYYPFALSHLTSHITIHSKYSRLLTDELPGVISELKAAEGRVQNITAKILSQKASLRGELEKYMDCLETAYKYKWGKITFEKIGNYIYCDYEGAWDDTRHCCHQQAAAYYEKMKAFPVDECRKILPPANQQDLKELKEQIEGVFYHNHLFSIEVCEFIFSV
ncbi:unnamed protein product [Trichobilharzia szidati]|nr:unnamed protein product [Trichobilharzia szidati]